MKKLSLNKQTIAYLNNPERVFGGEGDAGMVAPTGDNTCPVTCEGYTCNCATNNGQNTCPPYTIIYNTCPPIQA